MKYILEIILNPKTNASLTEEQLATIGPGHEKLIGIISESGELVSMDGIAEPAKSTVVRVRDGKTVTSEGSLFEGEDYFGGYYIVDVASQERAVELAAMIPDVHWSAVEVRPILEGPEEG